MTSESKPWGIELNTFCMLLHLSQLAGLIIPAAGLVLPIIMWATNKDEFPEVDRHGRAVMNWMISLLIYVLICIPLMFILIGFLGFFILVVVNLIFLIMGAVKANDGEVWAYPISIKFFKELEPDSRHEPDA